MSKMREGFEAWAIKSDFCTFTNADGSYKYDSTALAYAAWQASRAALGADVPEGYQLVPVEPDYAMLSADGCKKHHEGQSCIQHDNRRRIWRAMLAAAPKPQGGEA